MPKTYAIRSIYMATQRLTELHIDMTLIQVQTLLLVAETPGILQTELYKRIGISDSATSRNIGLLSEIGSRTRDGLGLIRLDVNPQDRREKNLTLTPKGRRLMTDILGDIYHGSLPKRGSKLPDELYC